MDYGLMIVGWFIAVIMFMGIICIRTIDKFANDEDSNDLERDIFKSFMQRYHDAKFSRKAGMVMYYGAWLLSIILFPSKNKNKDKK